MFLTTAAPLRRGSTPLPVKHQLRREEAISEDCDWIPGLEEPAALPVTDTAVPRDESFSQAAAAQSSYGHGHGSGALRIVLLGQNGVGKSSLALSLAGQSDRSLSIDSETQACGKELTGPGQRFSNCTFTCTEAVFKAGHRAILARLISRSCKYDLQARLVSGDGEGKNPNHPRDRTSDPQLLYFRLNLVFIGISAYTKMHFDSLDCVGGRLMCLASEAVLSNLYVHISAWLDV